MSEYTPITGELWERIGQAEHIIPLSGDSKDAQVRINLAWLKEKLDAIDSIHAQLERENAALKAELDRVLGEQEEHAHTRGESITSELREVAAKTECANGRCEKLYRGDLERIADRIDAEYERVRAESIIDMTDTWERIIEDARTCTGSAGNYTSVPSMRWTNEVDALVARCKALCERTKGDA